MRVHEKLPTVPRKVPDSFKSGPFTRMMDRIVMSGERLEARIERARMAPRGESRERIRAVTVFAALTVLYGAFGDPEHASRFFATVGAIAIGGKAWYSWRRNSYTAEASESDGAKVIRVAMEIAVTLVAVFALIAVMVKSVPPFPGRDRGIFLLAPAIVGALAYRRWKTTDPAPEYTLFVSGILWLILAVVAVLMWPW